VALAGRSHLLVAHISKCEHAIRNTLEGVVMYERASHIQHKNLASYRFVVDSYEVTSSIQSNSGSLKLLPVSCQLRKGTCGLHTILGLLCSMNERYPHVL
jgi:hypothetical protein